MLNISVKVQNPCRAQEKEQFVIWEQKLVLPHLLSGTMNLWNVIYALPTRSDVADAANEVKDYLTGDAEVYAHPEQYFDQVIEINLSELSPLLNGPFTPDLSTKAGADMTKAATTNDWPLQVEWGLIGSCTNSSYEDLSRAASIAQQAIDKGLKTKAEFGINPGSEKVRYTADRDGILNVF